MQRKWTRFWEYGSVSVGGLVVEPGIMRNASVFVDREGSDHKEGYVVSRGDVPAHLIATTNVVDHPVAPEGGVHRARLARSRGYPVRTAGQ